MGIKLKKHNEIAYDSVKKALEADNMTAVVHPTGTGKTYIALKWIEEHVGKTIYVAPTNHILNQVKKTIEEARINGELSDEEYENYQQVTFVTYTTLMELSKGEIGYQTIILDEFHRCGAPEWGKGVERLLENNKDAKVIGLTATPVRAIDNKDMADMLFQGKIASEMTLEETVAEGILNAPIYVNGIYSLESIILEAEARIRKVRDGKLRTELEEKLKKAKEKVRRHLEGAEGIEEIIGKYANKKDGRYIVFCCDIEDMHKKMQEAEKWFQKVEKVKLYEISYRKSDERNEEIIRMFREENDGTVHLLFSIDKLNEGVHINGIDGVIMLRKTESPIVYMQQLGRALSVGNNGVPLVLDLVNNIDSMDYIYDFAKKVEQIRKERGITDDDIGNLKILENQKDVKEVLKEITKKLRRDSSVIAILLRVCESLAKQGFDFRNFEWSQKIKENGKKQVVYKTLEDIVKEYPNIDIQKVIEETGVDAEYPIGQKQKMAREAAKGYGRGLITAEEEKRLIELGVINKETAISQFSKVCEALARQGFDFETFVWTKRIQVGESRKTIGKTLEDIAKECPNIDIQKVIEEVGVVKDYKIGKIKDSARDAAKGIGESPITDAEQKKLVELGVIDLNEKETLVSKFLRVCESLVRQGFDFKSFAWSRKIKEKGKRKTTYKTLEDIAKEYPNIDIDKVLKETDVEIKYFIGSKRYTALAAAKNRGECPITEAEKQRLIELGIIDLDKKKSSQELGQATFTAGLEDQKKLDEAQSVLEEAIQEKKRKSEEKEGEIVQDGDDEL